MIFKKVGQEGFLDYVRRFGFGTRTGIDLTGESRGYFNDVTGAWRYEDFFFEEFLPHIESTYRIRGEKRYRAVAGLSITKWTRMAS